MRSAVSTDEATFTVIAVDAKRKSLALVVAGTKGPVLSLPLMDDAAVLLDGRRIGPDRLAVGARVALRMDRTNRAIDEIHVVKDPPRSAAGSPTTPVISPNPPSKEELLRALPPPKRGVPYVYDVSRDGVKVTSELLRSVVDPPRFFPLPGFGLICSRR